MTDPALCADGCGTPATRERPYADNRGTVECDGMPTMMGCPSEITPTRPHVRPGRKRSGWLVVEGIDDDGKPVIPQALLHFCPSCALVVLDQIAKEVER